MKNYSYVITDYGPMRTFDPRQFRSELGDLQSEVHTKFEQLEDRINTLSGISTDNWLIKQVDTLPEASIDTCNTIYITASGSYATVNQDDTYTWVSISVALDIEERLTKIENTLVSIQALLAGTNDTTEDIDTLPEIVNFLKDYKNTETLKEEVQIDAESTSEETFNDVF